MKTVLCMKWGRKYGPEFVNTLARSVARHLTPPYRFLCLTDDTQGLDSAIEAQPLPDIPVDPALQNERWHLAAWQKIAAFRRGLADLDGPVLFLDIDLAITGDLDRLFAFEPGRFCIVRDWLEARRAPWRRITGHGYHPGADVNSSVFRYDMPKHAFVYDHLIASQAWVYRNFRIEQRYLGAVVGDRAYWPAEWVVSFKRSCRQPFPLNLLRPPLQPSDASVVVFHGKPNPDQAVAGYRGTLLTRTLPAPWLKEAWQ